MSESGQDFGPLTGAELRSMDPGALARLGEQALREHLVDTAQVAHVKYAPLTRINLEALLADRDLVRHPVRVTFALGTIARHQFGQPEPEGAGFVLFLHPALEGDADAVLAATAYFLPVMNYGGFINDDDCLAYGATLTGQTIDTYYRQLCQLAERVGAISRKRSVVGDRF